MKVKIIKPVFGLSRGVVYNLPEDRAVELIDAGRAEHESSSEKGLDRPPFDKAMRRGDVRRKAAGDGE
jgi:hypothetical protein